MTSAPLTCQSSVTLSPGLIRALVLLKKTISRPTNVAERVVIAVGGAGVKVAPSKLVGVGPPGVLVASGGKVGADVLVGSMATSVGVGGRSVAVGVLVGLGGRIEGLVLLPQLTNRLIKISAISCRATICLPCYKTKSVAKDALCEGLLVTLEGLEPPTK